MAKRNSNIISNKINKLIISDYKYSSDWPYPFSDPFINYLNYDIDGEKKFIEYNNIILPLLVRRKFIFKIGYFIYPPTKSGIKLSENDEKDFFQALTKFLKAKHIIDFIQAPLHFENFSHLPENSTGYELGIIKLPLKHKTEEDIFASFDSPHRRDIRKAIRENVEVKFGMEYFNDFYKIYQEKLTKEKSYTDPAKKILLLCNDSESPTNVSCGVAYHKGKPDAAIFNVNDRYNAYYLFAGTSKSSHAGSLRLLHWEVIKQYMKSGIENYHLGGARTGKMLNEKHTRLIAFKTGFGASISKGYHFVLVLNRFKYNLYKLLLKLKKLRK